jgi:hypothetical protein
MVGENQYIGKCEFQSQSIFFVVKIPHEGKAGHMIVNKAKRRSFSAIRVVPLISISPC